MVADDDPEPNDLVELVVPAEAAGERLDRFLADVERLAASRSLVQRWIDAARVWVDGRPGAAKDRLRAGSRVRVEPLPEPVAVAEPENIPLTILYRDDSLLVVDKPAGLVVHPAPGHPRGTLVNAVLHHAPSPSVGGDPLRPGIVHRLDKDTSGVMVVARTAQAKAALVDAFQAHDIEREYVAIVVGQLNGPTAYRDPIGRHPTDRKRFSSRTGRGKPATTHVKPAESFSAATLVTCRLETGRTHQIRVHLSDAGYPLVGDPMYGRTPKDRDLRAISQALGRQALHARVLGFRHPVTGEDLRFESEPPEDFREALSRLRGEVG